MLSAAAEHIAQDARRTARTRGVRARDHRPAKGAADDPLKHPALRIHAAVARTARRAPHRHPAGRRHRRRCRSLRHHRPTRPVRARRAVDARPGARHRRRPARRATGADRAGGARRSRNVSRCSMPLRRKTSPRCSSACTTWSPPATTLAASLTICCGRCATRFCSPTPAGVPYDGPVDEAAQLGATLGGTWQRRDRARDRDPRAGNRRHSRVSDLLVLEVPRSHHAAKRHAEETLLDRAERLEEKLCERRTRDAARTCSGTAGSTRPPRRSIPRGRCSRAASRRPPPRTEVPDEPPAEPATEAATEMATETASSAIGLDDVVEAWPETLVPQGAAAGCDSRRATDRNRWHGRDRVRRAETAPKRSTTASARKQERSKKRLPRPRRCPALHFAPA